MAGEQTRVREIYNAGEPKQLLRIVYAEGEDLPSRAEARGVWRDGPYSCGYARIEDVLYKWWRDDERGVAETEPEAWQELPSLIADPDYWDWIGE